MAHRGFRQEFLDYFNRVHEGTGSCGAALKRGKRVIVEDVLTEPAFAPHLKIIAAAGYRAVQSTPLFSRGGEPLGIISTHFRKPHRPSQRELRFVDLYARQAAAMIERERGEETLRESEHKFSLVFEKASFAIALAKLPDGIIVDVNPAWVEMFGFTKEQALGKTGAELGINRDVEGRPNLFSDVTGRGFVRNLEVTFFNKSGKPLLIALSIEVVSIGGKKYFLSTMRDISERKKAEQELHQAQAELAHVTRLNTLGEIGASIAHEINQPLGAIVNNSNVCLKLLGRPGSEERKREVLVDIANDAIRASAIIARIRALTKRSTSEKTFFSVDALVAEVLALADQTANKAGVCVKSLVPAQLSLHADRIQLQQMLLNLVMNGIQAMSATNEKKRTLTLQAKRQKLDGKLMITISVEDCGHGFSPEAAGRLFEPFFTTKSEGMGLGLAISRSIAEAHGGQLWAEPNTCPGATFYCALPADGARKSRAPKGVKS